MESGDESRETLRPDYRDREESAKEQEASFRNLVKELGSTTHATFGLYRYPAKFIPHVVAYALRRYSRAGMSVFDPFAGYGTVGTVARLYGNHYELWDLNPLLGPLHAASVMEPVDLRPDALMEQASSWEGAFVPDWPNIEYWYPKEFLPMLSDAWGFYHQIDDEQVKSVLLIPLIKATRHFSYNDEGRQKLSRSPISERRVQKLLSADWRKLFFGKLRQGLAAVLNALREYRELKPQDVTSIVRPGVDTLTLELSKDHDLLLTSPPYLQAQEYIRAAKMDLYWLGHSNDEVRELGKKEIPYRDVPECSIHSPTYDEFLDGITEDHLRRMFRRYFQGVLGSLTRLQRQIGRHLLLFVGAANVRARPVPISRIFAEHFAGLGWRHESTLIDTIVSRGMFYYEANPATGLEDRRMRSEHLVVLSRD